MKPNFFGFLKGPSYRDFPTLARSASTTLYQALIGPIFFFFFFFANPLREKNRPREVGVRSFSGFPARRRRRFVSVHSHPVVPISVTFPAPFRWSYPARSPFQR